MKANKRTNTDKALAAMSEQKVHLSIRQAGGATVSGDALCRDHADAKVQMSIEQGQRG